MINDVGYCYDAPESNYACAGQTCTTITSYTCPTAPGWTDLLAVCLKPFTFEQAKTEVYMVRRCGWTCWYEPRFRYPDCPSGYYGTSSNRYCHPDSTTCPSNMHDNGASCSKTDTYVRNSEPLGCPQGFEHGPLALGCYKYCERGFEEDTTTLCEGSCPETHAMCEGVHGVVCLEKKVWGEETDEDMCEQYITDLIIDGIELGVAGASQNYLEIAAELTGDMTRTIFDTCPHWYDDETAT